ncbi:hypothetical protein ACQP3F_32445, partial [Escherichia coli]
MILLSKRKKKNKNCHEIVYWMSNTKLVAWLCTGTYREEIIQGIAQVPGIVIQIIDGDLAWKE